METDNKPTTDSLQTYSQALRAKKQLIDTLQDVDDTFKNLTDDHMKLLYLISRYSHAALHATEKDQWIRKLPLLVLIYELTIEGVFDYDYAPVSEQVGNRRVYLNISQEGRDDIDDLREVGAINGLKLSSQEYQSITAYQVSDKGRALLPRIPQEFKKLIDDKIEYKEEVLTVHWTGSEFHLKSSQGDVVKVSTITDTEDVSYVSSPYLPSHLRYGNTLALTDNSWRVNEISKAASTIRDDTLNEVISISDVRLLIGEWVPFGSNHIASLNMKLGSLERIQGGLFTAMTDTHPEETKFSMDPGATKVSVLEFDNSKFLNFEAEVHFPEEEGVIQIEQFGVHVNEDGCVYYGMNLDAIMDRIKERISLDLLARVLVDIHQDSSTILESLITSYQRGLMSTVFEEDSVNREKFNMILAKSITPHVSAEGYMDKEDKENELKQVLGDTQSAHNLGGEDLLIIGRCGILLVTKNEEEYMPTLLEYLSLMSRRIFLDTFFFTTFSLYEVLRKTRELIDNYESNPTSLPTIRHLLSQTSKKSILLQELLEYLRDSLQISGISESKSEKANAFLKVVNINKLCADLTKRVKDFDKNMMGIAHELQTLREMTDVISENSFFKIQEAMQSNTKNLENVIRSNERSSSSLEVMQLVLSGTLAFEILDRLTGEWSVIDTWWGKSYIAEPFIETPGVWFVLNIALWFCVAFVLKHFMEKLTSGSSSVMVVRMKLNLPVNVVQLQKWLATKPIGEEEIGIDNSITIKKVSWVDDNAKWGGGSSPTLEITYDEDHSYLLTAFIQIEKGENRSLKLC